MLKKIFAMAGVAILTLGGCAREVYLQPVPCEPECPKCPCFADATECCPETRMETRTITYQVYDIPAPAVTYVPCDNHIKRCRTVCREVSIKR